MTSRRDVIKNLVKSAALAGSGGLLWGSLAEKSVASPLTLRPPGALQEEDFVNACIKCGKCVEDCPYDTLELATAEEISAIGTPYFKPREIPCYMCPDIPCTKACPSGALDLKKLTKEKEASINESKMGLAVIHEESCIAHWGIQCDACYRACPQMDEAITLEFSKNKVTGKHANMIPKVHDDACTGCGLCEHVCVTEKAAIRVLPIDVATGKVGDHYIKSWEDEDESRIDKDKKQGKSMDEDVESALDYLNSDDDLLLDDE